MPAPYPGQTGITTKTTPGGASYEEINVTINSKTGLIHHPDVLTESASAVAMIHFHGVGGQTTADGTRMQETRDMAIDRGWLVADLSTGTNWGNATQRDNYLALYDWLADIWNVEHVLFFGESMGGLGATLMKLDGRIPNVRAVVTVSGAHNLAVAHAKVALAATIHPAYGIASDGSDYVAKTATFGPGGGNADSVLRPASDYAGWYLRLYASTNDSTIPQQTHAEVFVANMAGQPAEMTLVPCTGGHLSVDQFRPSDVGAFYDRALAAVSDATSGTILRTGGANEPVSLVFRLGGEDLAVSFGEVELPGGKRSVANGNWNSTATWSGGAVPLSTEEVTINHSVTLNANATVDALTIAAGATLEYKNDTSVTLTSTGNVEVNGTLRMRPASATVNHTLTFDDVDESVFVGGGHTVLATDVGLWVHGVGAELDIAGTAKTAWTRMPTSLTAGATSMTVPDATGWRVGDLLAVTPTGPPSLDTGAFTQNSTHCQSFDEVTISAIAGNLVTFSPALTFAHPTVTFTDWDGVSQTYGAEVLNLTRNVVIQGTVGGKTHIGFFHVEIPPAISHCVLRHMGPRKANVENPSKTESVLGRYAMHFHENFDGTRGGMIEGVVIHGCGSHGFVPHNSHGLSFVNCVAHDSNDAPFWWDVFTNPSEPNIGVAPNTHDTLWDRCVGSKVWVNSTMIEGFRMSAFSLNDGLDDTNVCVDCVAVGVYKVDGVQMNTSAVGIGFNWPSGPQAIWLFSGCLAHNCGSTGFFSWQNDERVHIIDEFTTYHCGDTGIHHGAYSNNWLHRKQVHYGNRRAGVSMHAVVRRTNASPDPAPILAFEDIVVHGAGITNWGFWPDSHRFTAELVNPPTQCLRPKADGCRMASWYEPDLGNASYVHVIDPVFSTDVPEFLFHTDGNTDTTLIVDNLNGDGESFELRRTSQSGVLVPEWNARRTDL